MGRNPFRVQATPRLGLRLKDVSVGADSEQ